MSGVLGLDAAAWARLRTLLDQALALPAEAREAWLQQQERLPPELGHALQRLLREAAATTGAAGRLDTLPKIETRDFAPLPPPRQVGPYRLLSELGSGGMASVWLAERTDMLQRRQVALKLPHALRERADLHERLAREREILATLVHPNIAQLFDAGVGDDGQPYLALERVDGERIDLHAEHQAADVRERVRLMLQVARAVAWAHARQVVHRDLKPANVLVTGDGTVKLLDFGVAKLLETGGEPTVGLTRRLGPALTPEYAAPEQLAGGSVGPAADVFALGVMLYELLAGVRPHRTGTDTAIDDVPPPSRLAPPQRRRAIGSDLDTLVLAALRTDPAQRLDGAALLADELQRWLDHRPLVTRAPALSYRAAKFVRRHRAPVAAALAIGVTLALASLWSLQQARQARAEQQRAEAVKGFIAGVFRDIDPYQGSGGAPEVKSVLDEAARRLSALHDGQPLLAAELWTLLGWSYIGLHQIDGAERSAQAALTAASSAGAHVPEARRLQLAARTLHAAVLQYRGRSAPLLVELERLLPELRASDADPADLRRALLARAHAWIDQGRHDDAAAAANEALTLVQAQVGDSHPDAVHASNLVAMALRFARRTDEALSAAERAVALADRAFAGHARHPGPAEARMAWAMVLADSGRHALALETLRQARRDFIARQGEASPTLAYFDNNVAWLAVEAGAPEEAHALASQALGRLLQATDRGSVSHGMTLLRRGQAALGLGRAAEALDDLQAADEMLSTRLGPTSPRALEARSGRLLALVNAGQAAPARALATQLGSEVPLAPWSADRPPPSHALRVAEAVLVQRLAARDPLDGDALLLALRTPLPEERSNRPLHARVLLTAARAALAQGRAAQAREWIDRAAALHAAAGISAGPAVADRRRLAALAQAAR
ncbi:MAG: serine/threonine-protein kinase [Rubrivivax sp.]